MAELAFGIAEIILEKLASKAYEEISLAKSVKYNLKKLEETALNIKSVLQDAEKKQRHDKQLQRWLVRIKDVFDDAVDVLDEFECEALRRQVVAEYGSVGRKVRRYFSRSNPLAFRFSLSHRVKKIRERLDETVKEMAQFNLMRSHLNGRDDHHSNALREMTHSFVNPSEVIGREEDKAKIIDMLTSEGNNGTDSDVFVIPIVGLGGLGKTTLAKSVYNDETVAAQFELRLWVCLPLDFNVAECFRELLKSAITASNSTDKQNFSIDQALTRSKDVGNLSIDQLQMFLRSILNGKKILLVFDDVWNEDVSKWNEVRDLLLTACAKGSKFIVTTRSSTVASVTGTSTPHNLRGLSEKDSLSLFLKYAFGNEQSADDLTNLKDIGKKIMEKCKGVPLALKSLGSLLYSKRDEREWIRIRDSEIWELEQAKNDPILSALRLSYSKMPSYLKQCFAYCSLVPKNVRVEKDDMIWKWMALGLITSPNGIMELDEIGKLYFKELCTGSFFQYLDDAKVNFDVFQEFEMHDLVHDLAMSIIQKEHFILNSRTAKVLKSVKHLTVLSLDDDHRQIRSTMLWECKKLQSIYLRLQSDEKGNIEESFISTFVSSFRHLRLLDFAISSFEVLPSSIGKLMHLRYLNLSFNKKLKKLPDSICHLQSLQTLLLYRCEELEELPRDIRNMVSLVTLYVTTKQTYFRENGIGRLKSLRNLVVYKCDNLRSFPRDMRYCTTLRRLLIIQCDQLELGSTLEPDEEIAHKMSLRTLVIGKLPHTTAMPYWVKAAANTLQQLFIVDCPKLAVLPEWLPNLTSLRTLCVTKCPKLSTFLEGMQRLTSMAHLIIKSCDALEERCNREVGEDWPKIARVPNITVD